MNDRLASLTESEKDCLRLALVREGSKDIAPVVGLTHHTVDKRFKSAIRKLGVRSRFEAARQLAEYEAQIPQRRFAYQSPDARDQLPDVAAAAFPPMMGASSDHGVLHRGRSFGGELREEQAAFLTASPFRPTFPVPLRQPSGGSNDLNVWQRIGWVFGVTLLFALAFGVLSSGLMSLGTIATTVSGQAKQQPR